MCRAFADKVGSPAAATECSWWRSANSKLRSTSPTNISAIAISALPGKEFRGQQRSDQYRVPWSIGRPDALSRE